MVKMPNKVSVKKRIIISSAIIAAIFLAILLIIPLFAKGDSNRLDYVLGDRNSSESFFIKNKTGSEIKVFIYQKRDSSDEATDLLRGGSIKPDTLSKVGIKSSKGDKMYVSLTVNRSLDAGKIATSTDATVFGFSEKDMYTLNIDKNLSGRTVILKMKGNVLTAECDSINLECKKTDTSIKKASGKIEKTSSLNNTVDKDTEKTEDKVTKKEDSEKTVDKVTKKEDSEKENSEKAANNKKETDTSSKENNKSSAKVQVSSAPAEKTTETVKTTEAVTSAEEVWTDNYENLPHGSLLNWYIAGNTVQYRCSNCGGWYDENLYYSYPGGCPYCGGCAYNGTRYEPIPTTAYVVYYASTPVSKTSSLTGKTVNYNLNYQTVDCWNSDKTAVSKQSIIID